MSPSHTEPTPLGNAASVSEQNPELSHEAGPNIPPRRTLHGRKPSSSLLSKLLLPANELDESGRVSGSTDQLGETATNEKRRATSSVHAEAADATKHSSGTTTMATSIPPMRIPARSLGPSPVSSFSSHRELLNGRRVRGTSLERTHKERMVEKLPKAPFSTNPGDTGMIHTPTSTATTPLSSISDQPPTDGVRAKYRSWRDTNMTAAVEKTWSIGKQGSGVAPEGQVEKSIAEAMAGVEPNNRSRKASYSVRLFREGLPEEKPRRRDAKDGPLSKDKPPRSKEVVTSDDYFNSASSAADSPKYEIVSLPLQSGNWARVTASANISRDPLPAGSSIEEAHAPASDYTELPQDNIPDGEKWPNALPAQLLDDLRKRHNLTPVAAEGFSFSDGLPVTESEWRPSDEGDQEPIQPKTPAIQSGNVESALRRKSEYDEDSAEEQISSALFVPHQTSHESHDSPDREHSETDRPHEKKSSRRYSETKPEEWLVKHDIPPQGVDRSSPTLVANKQSPDVRGHAPSREDQGYFPSVPSSSEAASYDTYNDTGHTTVGEDLSRMDDPGTTPTRFSNGDLIISAKDKGHLHRHQQVTNAPLDAIELIPYRHQVGGHTTMWRFSKRAVCKQLNNRENEFYEKIERDHPRLLKFMPRYIGVLNVTFEKQQKRKVTVKDETSAPDEGDSAKQIYVGEFDGNGSAQSSTKQNGHIKIESAPRVISQSLNLTQIPTPTVTFADNRHIIPKSFMQPQLQHLDVKLRSLSDNPSLVSPSVRRLNQSQPPPPNGEFTFRPTLSDKHAASWGATTVNKKLRNEVFGEAFLQQPIPIHRHKKPAHVHRPLNHRPLNPKAQSHLRNSNSESNLILAQEVQGNSSPKTDAGEKSMRRRAIEGAAERNKLTPLTPLTPFRSLEEPSNMLSQEQSLAHVGDNSEADFEEKAGMSAPEAEIPAESLKSKRKRRYSSGGLRRKPEDVEESRGNLKYFEEADDAGYKGDGEDDIFKMDSEAPMTPLSPLSPPSSATTAGIVTLKSFTETSISSAPISLYDGVGTMLPAARNEEAVEAPSIPRPVNPKEAQTQPDKRVEFFLLLEDLTAGMKRPCIMDLKMGTRQYGVDANEAKQISQRRKCAETTSKELGVRVCGLQVWDVATQSYLFRDKYFGRDLKAGREFQDALTRFLYDGVDYSSILRHIPTILHKLSQLEVLIKHLRGYRFYAASLLMFYDGDLEDESATTDTSATEKEFKPRSREIDFKIADFANCVTAQMVSDAPTPRLCPPQHPGQPDKGFLRGLRSLRTFFLNIQKDIMEREGTRVIENKIVQNTIRNGNGSMHEMQEEDLGEVSY